MRFPSFSQWSSIPDILISDRCTLIRPRNGVQDGVRLLEDFFEHEVIEAALFDGFNLHFELVDLRRNHHVLQVANGQAVVPVHHGHLFVVEVDDVLRVLDDGRRVGSDVKLIFFTDSDDEGAGFARSNEQIWFVGVNDGDGIGAFNFLQCHLNGVGDGVRSIGFGLRR